MTEQEVIAKLDEGWLLSGDTAEDTPFGLIDPNPRTAGWCPMVPADLVRGLFDSGILTQKPRPGKVVSYRRH